MSSVSSVNSLLSSSSTTSSSSIDLSSLLTAATNSTSTGIDVNSAVAAAVYAAQAPERQWQAQQATTKSQITALTSIQTALSTVTSDLDALNNIGGPLTARTAGSSIPSVVTATAADGAAVGAHTISISSLAQTASWYSPSVSNSAATLGSMSLQIVGAGGTTSTYTTGSGTNTLAQLASAINAGSSGVTASIVSDSTGSRLALVGSASGAKNDFSISYGPVSGSSWSSSNVASASTALAAGSFQIGDGTQTSTINVAAGKTLTDVANQVNAAGLNVTASVVTDSSGAHLALAATGSSMTVTGDPAFSMTRAGTGADAILSVDGIPVTSASNTVTGAISGVTLNLLGTTTYTNTDGTTAMAQATVAVAADASQMTSAVSQFVTDYNSALSLVNSQFTYTAGSSSQGVLSGNSDLRSLQSALLGIASYTAPSSSSSGSSSGSATTLASLGVSMGDDGSLTLDSTALNKAITSNAASVQNFFQGTALNGFAQTFESSLKGYTNAASGSLALGITNLNKTYTNLQSQVDDYESGYIASQKTVLTAMYSKAEIALQSLPATLKQLQAELTNNSGS